MICFASFSATTYRSERVCVINWSISQPQMFNFVISSDFSSLRGEFSSDFPLFSQFNPFPLRSCYRIKRMSSCRMTVIRTTNFNTLRTFASSCDSLFSAFRTIKFFSLLFSDDFLPTLLFAQVWRIFRLYRSFKYQVWRCFRTFASKFASMNT